MTEYRVTINSDDASAIKNLIESDLVVSMTKEAETALQVIYAQVMEKQIENLPA